MSLRSRLLYNLLKQSKVINFAPTVLHHKHYKYEKENKNRWKFKNHAKFALLGSVIVGSAENVKEKARQDVQDCNIEAGTKRSDLPTYTAEEVSKHDNIKSFWVTYKHGVYDVTSFLPSHPGGEQIMNAAGFSIEPFWNVYGMHKTPAVYKLLESYRIGNLHDDDVLDHSDDELWAKEPYRDKRLLVKTNKPFNAEVPPKLQVQNFNTPNELFYVRQHMPVPELDTKEHKLKVVLVSDTTTVMEFSLQDLEQFQHVTVNAALMCAGNRRSEMTKVREARGLSWGAGAISNAEWGGVYLRDVLLASGLDETQLEGKHVILEGADVDATGVNFSTSIPLHMALEPSAQVLLATTMNGAQLPPDHGHPLRAVVPGAPAVRSVKWLQSITVSTEESPSHWHQKDYRSFNSSDTWETADFPSAPPVYSLPVTSAICDPADGDTVSPVDDQVEVKGYAYSGGGARVLRVDVSTDCGRNWKSAQLISDPAPPRRHYAWTLWSIKLPAKSDGMEIWVKATDSNFNTQPEKFDDIWNIRGILSNAYHKIKINIKR